MSADSVRAFVRASILDVKPDAVLPEEDDSLDALHLLEDVALDSLDLINLLFSLEEEYEVKIPEPEIEEHKLLLCGNLVAHVASKL
jgi:acyl carrier protein